MPDFISKSTAAPAKARFAQRDTRACLQCRIIQSGRTPACDPAATLTHRITARIFWNLTPAQRNAHNAKLSSYAHRPIAFLFRYIRLHPVAHLIVLGSVLAAVGCALGSQYAIKHLIDVLATGRHHPGPLWSAFALLVGLIAADNLLWRVGGWFAAHTFVAVTGDLRRDLFQYLIGHSPTYYAEKQPGTLASRITATSNAVYVGEHDGVERAAAVHRGDGRDPDDHRRQSDDGGRPARLFGRAVRHPVRSPGAARPATTRSRRRPRRSTAVSST